MKGIVILMMVLFAISISGCAPPSGDDALINECKAACQAALDEGGNLSAGPCIIDPMSDAEWVCDIAHSPREAIDNLPENQCSAYRNGTAKHFIELTPDCGFIQAR